MGARNDLDPDGDHWHWLASDLRVWRIERNMTQTDVGKILGVTKLKFRTGNRLARIYP